MEFVLKPCPFCGSIPSENELSRGTPDREGVPTAVACDECGALGPWVYIPEGDKPYKAFDEWNERW